MDLAANLNVADTHCMVVDFFNENGNPVELGLQNWVHSEEPDLLVDQVWWPVGLGGQKFPPATRLN